MCRLADCNQCGCNISPTQLDQCVCNISPYTAQRTLCMVSPLKPQPYLQACFGKLYGCRQHGPDAPGNAAGSQLLPLHPHQTPKPLNPHTYLQACLSQFNGCGQHGPDAARNAPSSQLLAHVQVAAAAVCRHEGFDGIIQPEPDATVQHGTRC